MDLSQVKLWISVPDHDGKLCRNCAMSLMRLIVWGMQKQVQINIGGPSGDSLVTRARNVAAAEFLMSDFTHFMYIDSDIGFRVEHIERLIRADKDVICGAYPKKQDNPEFPLNPWTQNLMEAKRDGDLMELKDAPTGFMMIKRSVFERIMAERPDLKCEIGPVDQDRANCSYAFFDTAIDPVDRRYLSEDFAFCRICQSLGMTVWLDPKISLSHFGSKLYFHGSPAEVWSRFAATGINPAIEGWMSVPELQWLNATAKTMRSITEIGCWKGRSTFALCSGCDGPVYAVDHFRGSVAEREGPHAEALRRNIQVEFLSNVGMFPNLKSMKLDSLEAAHEVPDTDMVFIDGGHTYAEVLADIDAWVPKAKRLLCGHDYEMPDVARAVNERFGRLVENPVGSIWTVDMTANTEQLEEVGVAA